jgi:LysM repeat protein
VQVDIAARALQGRAGVTAKAHSIEREGYNLRRLILGAAAAALVALLAPASAGAFVPHTVQPGETLWSIAAANNFTTRSLAAANGLPETAQVVVGQTVQIPSVPQAATALQSGAPAAPSGASPTPSASPAPMGGYTVRWGDTLSAIAARSGISVGRLAWMNGLDPSGTLIAGTGLKLPTGAPAAGSTSSGAPGVVPAAEPQPTNERVSPQLVSQVALQHGVSPSLANAIAQQESGHNNALVSSANARGVMQILPGTWDFVERSIAGRRLNPVSAYENVHAGVMYLGRLLQDTGNVFTATASYYQGEGSVRRIGMLPETRRYVNSVIGLRAQYGGPR